MPSPQISEEGDFAAPHDTVPHDGYQIVKYISSMSMNGNKLPLSLP